MPDEQPAKKRSNNPNGKPPTNLDLEELEKLCGLQCTMEEMGAWFGLNARTMKVKASQPKYREVMQRGYAKGRISVRRNQMKLLEEGNATMGVWLGKQLLGQRDDPRDAPAAGGSCPPFIVEIAVDGQPPRDPGAAPDAADGPAGEGVPKPEPVPGAGGGEKIR